VCQRADGDALHAGLRHLADAGERDAAAGFEVHAASQAEVITQVHGQLKLFDGHVVQQNNVDVGHVQGPFELIERVHFKFDEGVFTEIRAEALNFAADGGDGVAAFCPREHGEVVVLDEHGVVEAFAMILSAAGADGVFFLADLPGYGYAKVSKEAQNKWQQYLEEYLLNREQIASLIHLIDGRHEIQKNDFQMREWVHAYNLPVFTVATKIDYVPKNKVQAVLKNVEKQFGGLVLPFSATDHRYNEEILTLLVSSL